MDIDLSIELADGGSSLPVWRRTDGTLLILTRIPRTPADCTELSMRTEAPHATSPGIFGEPPRDARASRGRSLSNHGLGRGPLNALGELRVIRRCPRSPCQN